MDVLFTTSLIINGETVGYDVSFENDAYLFMPASDSKAQSIKARREDDTWKIEGAIGDIAEQQATAALEQYLLSQH